MAPVGASARVERNLTKVRKRRYAEGSPPARRPSPATVTFLNGAPSDISIWWTHGIQKMTLCDK
jgi:hypothetical protein